MPTQEGRKDEGKEGRREGGKEGMREGGKEGRREGGNEGRREGEGRNSNKILETLMAGEEKLSISNGLTKRKRMELQYV